MKFGKELLCKMVPEWQAAYVDYEKLKGILKEILHLRRGITRKQYPREAEAQASSPETVGTGGGGLRKSLKRRMTMYRAFSGLTRMESHRSGKHKQRHEDDDDDGEAILVNTNDNNGVGYESIFLMSPFEEGGEFYEVEFFKRVDEELNKVNEFYKGKVEEVVEEAYSLNTQMDALIALRLKVEVDNHPPPPDYNYNHPRHDDYSPPITTFKSASTSPAPAPAPAPTPSSSPAPPLTPSTKVVAGPTAVMDTIHEEVAISSSTATAITTSKGHDDDERNKIRRQQRQQQQQVEILSHENNYSGGPLAPLEILKHVKMNNPLETPRSTLKGLWMMMTTTTTNYNYKELSFNQEELRRAEEQLKKAFVEFYRKLRLLKSYSFLNLLAFSKIMKKYDKITSRSASRSYLKMVDNSYLGSSYEVTKLLQRVEDTFIKHFCNSNRKKGMKTLRPTPKREKHRVTFSLGFLAGCSISLIVALILIVNIRKIYNQDGSTSYMNTMFPLYSLYGFTVLHMLIYAANIYFWKRYRINFSFIFGFKQGTELGYREVFLISTTLSILALAGVLANLDMEMDKKTKRYKTFTALVPLGLATILILVIFCPFDIIYRSSRMFLLRCSFHCLCAPLYKVTLPDFFLADQLTSQVQAIRSVQFYICYYGWGDFKRRQDKCFDYPTYKTFLFIVAIIPYWARFLQCIRRAVEEKDKMQGYNGVKYLTTIVAVAMRTSFELHKTEKRWRWIAGITSAIAAIVNTYWDIVIDWGLLRRKSKNRWLRDKLLVPHKIVYFAAIVLNVLLRFAWIESIFGFKVNFMHKKALAMMMACLEIIRRGVWNFFRLENEHLNNVGKYRAFKSVPLPFNYDEDEDAAE